MLTRWSEARKPVFFDLQPLETPLEEHILWRLLVFNPDDGRGLIALVRMDWLVQAVLDGNSVPLAQCEEEDAWRFRREMVQVLPNHQGEGFAQKSSCGLET